MYNTPVFELKAGAASCPMKPGAQPRDAVYFTAVNPVAQGLNPSTPATFNLKVVNTSPSSGTNINDKRTYKLNYIQSSNMANETITTAGSPFQSNSPYILSPLGYLDSAIIPVSITRQNGSLIYSYESERFTITDTCDEDLQNRSCIGLLYLALQQYCPGTAGRRLGAKCYRQQPAFHQAIGLRPGNADQCKSAILYRYRHQLDGRAASYFPATGQWILL